ncbi:MAG: MerR family DNA-binding protein [Gemmataceae bacterium]|nr:MerR family DNA-binding protein [Gemmataceae bacterium]
MKPLTIGQVAKRTGIGIETIRFYERQGLLQQPERKASGYRQYTENVLARLRFIRRAKELGFSLREIGELFAIQDDSDTTRADVKELTARKLADIEARILDLHRMRGALTKLLAACPGHGPLQGCPILDALNHEPTSSKEDEP